MNPEDISSSLPVVPHCTGTESVISRSQKLEKHTLLPLSNKYMRAEFCGERQSSVLLLLFDRRGRGVNGSFREDKIKRSSISLSLIKAFVCDLLHDEIVFQLSCTGLSSEQFTCPLFVCLHSCQLDFISRLEICG